MDSETGEYFADTETGEISVHRQFNNETGEYEGSYHQIKKFRVPSSYIPGAPDNCIIGSHRYVTGNKQQLEIITAMIFLLPSIVLFYPVVGVFVALFEMVIHSWTHKKNKNMKNGIYYQSPLYPITKELCGLCKYENAKKKITKIQDLRNDKLRKYELDYIRRVCF